MIALLLLVLCAGSAMARDAEAPRGNDSGKLARLIIAEAYLELYEGPGRGYAITQVVPRGDAVDVLYRRTEWFRVRTPRGVEGWARERDLIKAQWPDGSAFTVSRGDREGFTSHHWELGVQAGDFGGATLISGFLSRSLNEQLAIELTGSQFLGNTSNGWFADLGMAHVLRPEWRLSPLFTLGTGVIRIEPKTTLVVPDDRTNQTAYVGAGLRFYLTRRFFVRGEYRSHMLFTHRNDNEEIDEWKLGFAFFF
jgi:opacity protein-like surface antigen